jgi:hypothetical protein
MARIATGRAAESAWWFGRPKARRAWVLRRRRPRQCRRVLWPTGAVSSTSRRATGLRPAGELMSNGDGRVKVRKRPTFRCRPTKFELFISFKIAASRSLTLVGYAAGGPTDTVARLTA